MATRMELGLGLARGCVASAPGEAPEGLRDLTALFLTKNGGAPTFRYPSDSLLPEATGMLRDTSRWGFVQNASSGAFVDEAIHFDGAAPCVAACGLSPAASAGHRYIVEWKQELLGGDPDGSAGISVSLAQGGGTVGTTAVKPDGWFSTTLTATGAHNQLRFAGGPGKAFRVSHVRIREFDPAARRFDVIAFAPAQSNIVGGSAGLPDDRIDLPHDRIFMAPGLSSPGYLTTENLVTAAREPLTHRDASWGLGPVMAFARWYAEHVLAEGRDLVLVCTAKGGTGLVGTSSNWNPNSTVAVSAQLFNRAVADTKTILALNPANRLVLTLACQGESDRGITGASNWDNAFRHEFLPAWRTAFPDARVLMLGLNPDPVNGENQAAMIAAQAAMDFRQTNGIAGLVYSAWRAADWGSGTKANPKNDADRVHFSGPANRLRGIQAALDAREAGFFAA